MGVLRRGALTLAALAALLSALAPSASAAGPVRVATATLSGSGNQTRFNAVVHAGFYNFAVGFSSQGANGTDILVARYDDFLNPLSSATIDGSAHGSDEAQAALYDGASGALYVVGYSSASAIGGTALWIGKFNSTLTLLSSATFTGIPVPTDQWHHTGLVMDGGNLVTVNTTFVAGHSQILLAAINPATLTLVSSSTYTHGFNANGGFGLAADGAGNLYVSGGVAPSLGTSDDIWVGKFTSALAFVSEYTTGGAALQSDGGFDIAVQGSDVYVAGYKINAGVTDDIWVGRLTTSLSPVTTTTITSPVAGNAQAWGIVATSTRVYIAGQVNTSLGQDAYLAELDRNLAMISSDTYDGGNGGLADYAFSLALDTMSGEAFVGGALGVPGPGQAAFMGKWGLPNPPPVSAFISPSVSTTNALGGIAGTAQARTLFTSSPTITVVNLKVQDSTIGKYWDGTSFSSVTPVNLPTLFIGGSSGTWTYSSALTSSLTNGHRYLFQSQASDSAGGVEPLSAPFSLLYDTDQPVAVTTQPVTGVGALNSLPLIYGTAFDPTSSVSAVLVKISSGPSFSTCWNGTSSWAACPANLPTNLFNGTWTVAPGFMPPPGQLAPGDVYRVTATAYDPAGNISPASTPVDVRYAAFNGIGNFASPGGARLQSPNGFHETVISIAVDNVSAGGPYYYETFVSTSDPFFGGGFIEGVAKLDANGVELAIAPLPGDQGEARVAVDGSLGAVYVADRIGSGPGQPMLFKFDTNLNPLARLNVNPHDIGNISELKTSGGYVFTADDGGDLNHNAKIVKYDSALVAFATATYSGGVGQVDNAYDLEVYNNAAVYVAVGGSTDTEKHLLRYDSNLVTLAADKNVSALTDYPPSVAVSTDGARVYLASYGLPGDRVYVRAFDANNSLNYTGIVSTTTGALAPFGKPAAVVRTAPNGDVFLGYTDAYDGPTYPGHGDFIAIKFDRDLRFLLSQNFNGVGNSTDVATAMTLLDSSNVVVAGMSWNGTDYDAAAAKFFMPGQAGGQLFAQATNLAPATLGANGKDVPMLALALEGTGGPVQLDSIAPILNGNAPGGAVSVSLWRDANGDGVFTSTADTRVATAFFAAGIPPQATLPLGAALTSTTQYYFLTVTFSSMTAGNSLGVSLPNPGFFGLSSGFPGPGIAFPLQSVVATVQQSLYANPGQGNYPAPIGGAAPSGGFDTGLFAQTGQNILVTATGTWDAGGYGVVTATGLASTGGLNNLALGALVGRFGGGQWFFVGSSATVTAAQPGDLFLAMNDTYYFDNAGQLTIAAQVQVSTVAKVWTGGSGINLNASVNANWLNGLPPLPGDLVVFDGAVSNASCNWDIYGANLFLLRATNAYAGSVTITAAASQLSVSHDLQIDGGRLSLSPGVTLSVQQAVKVGGGVFDMGPGGATLQAGQFGVYVDSGGVFQDNGATASVIQSLTAGAFYPFQVMRGTLRLANTAQTTIRDTSGLFISSMAALGQFSNVSFTNTFLSQTPSIRFAAPPSTTSIGGFALNNVGFDVNVSTNIDASLLTSSQPVTVTNAYGAHFGSPYDNDPSHVVSWRPDGGSSGQITGTIAYTGSQPGQIYLGFAKVANSGDGKAFFAALPGAASQLFVAESTGMGAFTISLPAPNTYYLMAWKTQNADGIARGFDPVGGYSQPGIAKASPLYLPAGGSVAGAAITIADWGAVSGIVKNDSNQFGPIIIEAWGNGAPHVGDPMSRVVLPSLGLGGSQPYSLPVPNDSGPSPTLPSGQLYVQGFVDVNGNGGQEPFEAQATSATVFVNPLSTTTAVALDITGGGSAPGGALTVGTVNPFTYHNGSIGFGSGALSQAMLRLDLSAAVDSVTLTAVQLDLSTTAPPGGLYLKLYRDSNNDGVFQDPDLDQPPTDMLVGLAYLAPGLSSGVVVASAPEILLPGQPRTYFAAVDLLNQKPPAFTMSIASTSSFTLSQGSAAAQGIYPIVTAPAQPKFAVRASQIASSLDTGGADTGITLDNGLSVTVSSITGLWKPDGTTLVGAAGVANSTGLATLAPSANYGQLIGRIGDAAGSFTSSWFPVVDGTPILSGLHGDLFLAINDYNGAYFDNAGAVLARFSVSGSTTGAIAGTISYPGGTGTLHVTANTTDPNCPNCTNRPLAPVASINIPVTTPPANYPYEFDGLPSGPPYVVSAALVGDPSRSGDSAKAVYLNVGSTVTGVNFAISQGTGSISGTLSYAGVQTFGAFTLVVATTTDFNDTTYFYGSVTTPTASAFTLNGLPTPATYYAMAFRDVNGDRRPDGSEPFGVYGNSGGALFDLPTLVTPISLGPGGNAVGRNVTLLDRGAVQGGLALTAATGPADIVVQLGHGQPGDPNYAIEDEAIYTLPSGGSAGDVYAYSVDLLRPATDYTVFAFLSANLSDVFVPGDTFGLASVPSVAPGGFTNADVMLHGSQPPSGVPSFHGHAASTAAVVWNWSPLPEAAGYTLVTSTGGVVLGLNAPATTYTDALIANSSSSITGIRAYNGFGTGPVVSVAPVYSYASVPGQPLLTPAVNSAAVAWPAAGNPPGTTYQVGRATAAAGPFTVVAATTSLSIVDYGLVPATQYYWAVGAVNGNGVVTSASLTQTTTTLAASGPAVGGTLTYGGRQPGLLVVRASTSPAMAPVAASIRLPSAPSQSYFLPVLGGGATYFVDAFVDLFGDGQPHGGAAKVLASTVSVSASPVAGFNLAVPGDTLAPSFPVGLSVATPFGSDQLAWSAPTTNSNGSQISDLAGFRVYRATLAAGPFTVISSGTVFASTAAIPYPPTSFTDAAPAANTLNYYRVTALDYDGNESQPSGAAAATPFFGGTISGSVQDFGSSQSGPLRVRLSTTPFGASYIAESTLNPFSFTNLTDGVYYVRAFRDANGDNKQQDNEAAGTLGGLAQPYQQQIFNGSTISGTQVTVCDRTAATFGQGAPASYPINISAAGCPALDQGAGFFTSLLGFTVGGGGAGSVGVGANLFIQMQSAFANRLILLGPNGGVVAQNSNGAGATISFSPTQPGRYLIEPTSFNPYDVGSSTVSLSVSGGFAGAIAGQLSYNGTQNTGAFVVQLFTSPDPTSYPIFQSTFAAGGYSVGGLPDGVYYLRAYRDGNGNFVHDAGEPAGVFGVSGSSLTAITIQGGVTTSGGGTAGAPVNLTLTDPALGSVSGQIFRQGTQAGTIRIIVGPPGGTGSSGVSPVAMVSTAAAGAYTVPFIPPATNYIVEAWVDVNGDSHLDPLEARGSSQPVTVQANQAASVNLLVADPGSGSAGNASIQGNILYTGVSTGPLMLGFATDAQFQSVAYVLTQASTGTYLKTGVVGGTSYYIAAFLDSNNNGEPDDKLGEPIGFYGAAPFNDFNSKKPVFVPNAGSASADITLADSPSGSISGQVTYNGSAPLSQPLVVQANTQSGGGNFNSQKAAIVRVAGKTTYGYTLPFLAAATNYNVVAFVDANGNGSSDFGEPFAQYGQTTCLGAGPCFGAAVAVSSGPGTFPAYGINMTVQDPGTQGGALANTGSIDIDGSYLGSQGGPIVVRAFTNAAMTGTPFATLTIAMPTGPGDFRGTFNNLPFGTYYLDAFRDPSGSGFFNAAFDAYGTFNSVSISANNNHNFTNSAQGVVDPGQGGSVNVYSGDFSKPGGARFDGGAVDIAAGIALDTITAGGPYPYVLGLTKQNQGLLASVVKYSSSGVFLTSTTLAGGDNGVNGFALDGAGDFFIGGQISDPASGVSSGTIIKLGPNLAPLGSVVVSSYTDVRQLVYANGSIYAALESHNGSNVILGRYSAASLAPAAIGTFSFPQAAFPTCSGPACLAGDARAIALDGAGNVFVVVGSNGGGAKIYELLKYAPGLGSITAQADVTPLMGSGVGNVSVNLGTDASGDVYLALTPPGDSTARSYKFSPSLQQLASASFGPVVSHFGGGLRNLVVGSDGYVYEGWETSANGGDMAALRYDANLALVSSRTFDGLDNAHEDFAFGIDVLDAAHVFLTGGATNANGNLDWATVRLDLTSSGAQSGAGQAVVISTANATNAVFGTLVYAGAQQSSGTVRAVLLPMGQNTPIRVSSSPFAAATPYLFNNVPPGVYQVQAFVDGNANFFPDAGEAVGYSSSTGFQFFATASRQQDVALCDRFPLAFGQTVNATLTPADCPSADRPGAYQRLYTFAGSRGQAVTITNAAVNFVDTALNLYDQNGHLVAVGDDSAADFNARIKAFVLPADGLYTIAASPFAAGLSSATINLTLSGSAGSLGSIAGSVAYTGVQGGQIVMGLFSTSTFLSGGAAAPVQVAAVPGPGAFSFAGLASGTTYYLGGFVDVNANRQPDSGEDVGFFGSTTTGPAPILLRSGQNVTGVNFTISPQSTATLADVGGVVTYSGTRAGTLHVELWPSSSFTGQPAATRLIPTGAGPWDVLARGGLPYYVRAWLDANGNFVLDPDEPSGVYAPHNQGAEAIFAPSTGTLSGVNLTITDPGTLSGGVVGEGTAAIAPSTAAAGSPVFVATITYTAGTNGVSAGGRIGVTLPPGFPPPQPGQVSVSSDAAATLSGVSFSNLSAFVTVTNGSVASGKHVSFRLSGGPVACVVSTQTFTVTEAQNGGVAPQPLLQGSPSLGVVPGPAAAFQPSNPYLSVTQGVLSDQQTLVARDLCGNQAPIAAGQGAQTVTLRAKRFDLATSQFVADASVGLSSGAFLSTAPAMDFAFAVGQSSAAFYALSASTGAKNIEVFYTLAAPATFYYGVTALPDNALTGVSVSSVGFAAGGSSTTIAPANGAAQAYVNFTLGDPNQNWHVLVSSRPFKAATAPSPLWETWGYGQPNLGQVFWDGRYSPWINGGARVPSGSYYVRVEVAGGGVHDDSLLISVVIPQVAGKFLDAGQTPNPPLAGVSAQVYGPNGATGAQSDSAGAYILPGLSAGSYNMFVSRQDFLDGNLSLTVNAAGAVSTFTALTPTVTASTNASGGLDIAMTRAAVLVVTAAPSASYVAQQGDQWGSLQVNTSTSLAASLQRSFFQPLRLPSGTTTFDDGGQWDSSSQQFLLHTLFKFTVAPGSYTVTATVPGFSPSTAAVYVAQGLNALALPALSRKSSVAGTVALLSNPNGAFVSVNAVPLSTATTAAGGGAGVQLAPGVLSAAYTVADLDAGTYLLRANANGLAVVSTGPIAVPASSDVTHVDFSTFSAGASIAGTITFNADTTGDNLNLQVSAWSPGALNFGSTNVYVAGGAAGLAVPYQVQGLSSGATYQVYVNVGGHNGARLDPVGQLPIQAAAPSASANVAFTVSSGVISGTILLPSGNTDFLNVSLIGQTVASAEHPDDVGHVFTIPDATQLPNFQCFPGPGGVTAGACPVGSSTGTFTVQNQGTETDDITLYYATTGQTKKFRLSTVNGSTTTVFVDLSRPTYAISGSINNQITSALFNTNPAIVANAPLNAPQGYPTSISSTTARVVAIKQDLSQYNVAISTVFDPVSSRVGFLTAAGTWTISNVPSGVYYVRTADLRSCATCDILVPRSGQLVNVAAADVSSVTLTLSDGYSVSGSLSLDGGLQDSRVFNVTVLNQRQEVVRSTSVYLGDATLGVTANSVGYSFTNLPAGDFYTLLVSGQGHPHKYVGRPIKFPNPGLSPNGLQANLASQDVVLQRAAYFTGRMLDSNTGELISAGNATLLAPNFQLSATASPWVEGGFAVAASSISGRPIQGDGTFLVGPLIPNISYALTLGQLSWDPSFLANGSQNYTPVTISGLTPQAGQLMDVGVVSLNQGQSLTGTVRASSTTGAGLGNILITAKPSFGGSDLVVQTYTNQFGKYTLWVSTYVSNQFDVTAAPREGNLASDGKVYGQVTLRNVNLLATTTADFVLNPLLVTVTGQIVVADAATGGQLSYPFGAQKGFPAAAVFLQPQGVVPQSNPLGDIQENSDSLGVFSIPGLSTGTFNLRAVSIGYAVFNATVTASTSTYVIYTGSNTASNYLANNTITLQRGASVTGRILRSDGTAPNSSEVGGVAAANFAQGEFIVGTVDLDKTAKTVNSYTISGFKPGISYSLVILPADKGDVVVPPEGSGITFLPQEATATKNVNLTYTSPGLQCVATAKAVGNQQFQIKIDCNKDLRNQFASDNDLSQLLTVSTYTSAGTPLPAPNGTGTMNGGDKKISADRKEITAIYATAAGETQFSLRLKAAAASVDPKTGANFTTDQIFDFYAGLTSNVSDRISNINGGSVQLQPSVQDELLGTDEKSRIDLQPGTFAQGSDSLPDSQAVASALTTIVVGIAKAKDLNSASVQALRAMGYVPSSLSVLGNASAFPPELAAAMTKAGVLGQSTSAVSGVNPISSFYSIFLPLGVRHQLKQRADLTFSYDTSASTSAVDPANINVWWYDAVNGKYVLENTNRRLDTTNKTITVSVNHFSVFVVLNGAPSLTVATPGLGPELLGFNFPNPSDCIVHSNIQRDTRIPGGAFTFAPFMGTMVRFTTPTGDPAGATIRIYDLAGELVRSFDQGDVAGDTTNYTPWDCTNNSGRPVASGIYIGEVQWGSHHKFFKIALVRGSGL